MLQVILRALIPSWRFFSEIGDTPLLYLQIFNTEHRPLSDWKLHSSFQVNEAPDRSFAQLFYNPDDNGRLALRSLVMRSLEELKSEESEKAFRKGLNYPLLLQMCLAELARSIDINAPFYRFKIVVETKELEQIEVFASDVIQMRAAP